MLQRQKWRAKHAENLIDLLSSILSLVAYYHPPYACQKILADLIKPDGVQTEVCVYASKCE